MNVLPIPAFNDNYIWMIINEDKGQAFCVDPGQAKPVLDFLQRENLQLNAILLTHHHFDHIDGTSELLAAYPGIDVYGPKDSRIPQVNHLLQDKDVFTLDSCHFQVISTPGHTATHISLYEPHYKWLFCGDTLFSAGCGRVFDGTIEELHDSLQKLKNLPDDTQVFCAHEYTLQNLRFAATVEPDNLAIRNHAQRLLHKASLCSLPSSIAVEKQINPFFRTDSSSTQHYANQRGIQETDSLSVFKQIRSDKDSF